MYRLARMARTANSMQCNFELVRSSLLSWLLQCFNVFPSIIISQESCVRSGLCCAHRHTVNRHHHHRRRRRRSSMEFSPKNQSVQCKVLFDPVFGALYTPHIHNMAGYNFAVTWYELALWSLLHVRTHTNTYINEPSQQCIYYKFYYTYTMCAHRLYHTHN